VAATLQLSLSVLVPCSRDGWRSSGLSVPSSVPDATSIPISEVLVPVLALALSCDPETPASIFKGFAHALTRGDALVGELVFDDGEVATVLIVVFFWGIVSGEEMEEEAAMVMGGGSPPAAAAAAVAERGEPIKEEVDEDDERGCTKGLGGVEDEGECRGEGARLEGLLRLLVVGEVGFLFLKESDFGLAEEVPVEKVVVAAAVASEAAAAVDTAGTGTVAASGFGGRLAFTIEANDFAPQADIRKKCVCFFRLNADSW
jgi:hypothetical protein